MKKVKAIAATALMSAVLFQGMAQAAQVNVVFNGEKKEFTPAPYIEDGRTMVPMRAIFNLLGAPVSWDDETRTVISVFKNSTSDSNYVILQIDNTITYINNEEYILDVPARIVDDRTFVPLRFVTEAFGGGVEWDQETYTVNITSQN